RCESNRFYRTRMLKLLYAAIGKADIGGAATGKSHNTLRTGSNAGNPFPANFSQRFKGTIRIERTNLSILAPGQEAVAGLGRRQKAVMQFHRFMAIIQPVDDTIGKRKVRDVTQPENADTV